ncbi:glycoside hydrolase [Streptomyces sp. NBC_00047]|uniref:sialidase family protein n=1 Tax=Streptomyces sp. NBC_00047 TaxID=2975627 RepID=UPI00225B6371|nr:sialidase family protein [Streptomyces sp. NBC_00047]MCX5610650.1 glycoside hydrolase [Streptomyces sp. NBC_00047]
MGAVLHLQKLHCVRPDDSLSGVDEVSLQIDGRQVWPNDTDGVFSMSTGDEVPMDVKHTFDSATTVTLFDAEDIGGVGSLGAEAFRNDDPLGDQVREFRGDHESIYQLTYRVKKPEDWKFLLDPVALGGSAVQAWASHEARAKGIAKFFAATHPLSQVQGPANEGNTAALLAHLAAADADPNFKVDGVVSRVDAPLALRRLERKGHVGTSIFEGNYDFALKVLMPIAHRYGHLLDVPGGEPGNGVRFILDQLVHADFLGGHNPSIEVVKPFPPFTFPETENHLLMIETSRYLVNQLRHEPVGGRVSDDQKNLTDWLLKYLQTIAQHDFLEFSARPYARMSLPALLNLYEFASEPRLRTAAQNILDYTFTKCALSANRGRRVNPYRRHQSRIHHAANFTNDLYTDRADTVTGFFLAYTGMTDEQGAPARFPESKVGEALIAATSTYRPPAAAYQLALARDVPPHLHRFYHGIRPELPESGETADAGIEIYYRSPSFMLTAGGCFLNSGYGRDEVSTQPFLFSAKKAWNETSRAQATALIPTRVPGPLTAPENKSRPLLFSDLIRFDPYPDPAINPEFKDAEDNVLLYHTTAVNMGVNRGIAAGGNLRPSQYKVVLEHFMSESPALTSHHGRLCVAWRAANDEALSVAKVMTTTAMGMDGVEGVERGVRLGFTSDAAPALASHDGRLWLAWRGSGNEQLNLAFSDDDGVTFRGIRTFSDTSDHAPALASHAGRLYLAWTGRGGERLNIAKVSLFASTAGAFGIEGLENHIVLGQSSEKGPALASHNGRLWLAWRGSGNEQLNLAFSDDDGVTFQGTQTFSDTSTHAPALASHRGRLYLAWKGLDIGRLNVARVSLVGNTAGAFGIEGLESRVTFNEGTRDAPALGSHDDMLCLARNGPGEIISSGPVEPTYGRLHLRISRDGSFTTPGPWRFLNLGDFGFYVAVYWTPPAVRTQRLGSLGIVYAAESVGTDFAAFEAALRSLNPDLPARFEYGKSYEFHTPDGGRFSCSFNLEGDRYTERVVDLDAPVADLTTLPLVSGEYMRATDHSGRIEIWAPGHDDVPALVLDHQNGANPERIDNEASRPQLQHERTQAALDFAEAMSNRSRNLAHESDLVGAALAALDSVSALERMAAPPELLLPITRARAVNAHDATSRFLAIHDTISGIRLFPKAVVGYSDWAARDRASVLNIADLLMTLSSNLATEMLLAEAVTPARAALDVLEHFTPRTDETARAEETRARATFTLALRLKFAGLPEDALPIAEEALRLYLHLAEHDPSQAQFVDTMQRLADSLGSPSG